MPVLLSVPHAGNAYSPSLLAAARVGRDTLAALEDPLVDRLVGQTVEAGAQAIVALVPRAAIDLNRSLDDFDPAMVSPPPGSSTAGSVTSRPLSRRADAGLGLVPSRLAGAGAIWRRDLAPGEVETRIAGVYRPYHDALASALAVLRDRYGVAVLLDCHSMPPPRGGAGPGIVLGDRHGTSCGPDIVAAAEAACADRGVACIRNDPYAGGEIVARHGRPAEHVHAMQIEFDRRLYLAPNLRDPGPGFGRTGSLLAALMLAVVEAAAPSLWSQAAE